MRPFIRGKREREGGGGADGIRWFDSVICNNGLYIKHIFASTPGPSIFIPKCSPSQPSHSEKQENETVTLIDHAGLTSNMNFQNIFPEFQP